MKNFNKCFLMVLPSLLLACNNVGGSSNNNVAGGSNNSLKSGLVYSDLDQIQPVDEYTLFNESGLTNVLSIDNDYFSASVPTISLTYSTGQKSTNIWQNRDYTEQITINFKKDIDRFKILAIMQDEDTMSMGKISEILTHSIKIGQTMQPGGILTAPVNGSCFAKTSFKSGDSCTIRFVFTGGSPHQYSNDDIITVSVNADLKSVDIPVGVNYKNATNQNIPIISDDAINSDDNLSLVHFNPYIDKDRIMYSSYWDLYLHNYGDGKIINTSDQPIIENVGVANASFESKVMYYDPGKKVYCGANASTSNECKIGILPFNRMDDTNINGSFFIRPVTRYAVDSDNNKIDYTHKILVSKGVFSPMNFGESGLDLVYLSIPDIVFSNNNIPKLYAHIIPKVRNLQMYALGDSSLLARYDMVNGTARYNLEQTPFIKSLGSVECGKDEYGDFISTGNRFCWFKSPYNSVPNGFNSFLVAEYDSPILGRHVLQILGKL